MRKTKSSAGSPQKGGAPDRLDMEPLSAPHDPEQRHRHVAVAAYFIAERRGFGNGNPDQDWAEAESEIDRMIAEGRIPARSEYRDDP